MTNREFYKNKIIDNYNDRPCADLISNIILPYFNKKCENMTCDKCRLLQHIWLEEEYEDPDMVDWSKVAVDTPILVKDFFTNDWNKRYFAKCDKEGKIFAWGGGRTSFSKRENDDYVEWAYAKLYKEGEE